MYPDIDNVKGRDIGTFLIILMQSQEKISENIV